ncbi:MAG: hypothetical protein LBR17_07965 [Bacteroidales bacterium]|jgi:hypothetical protein|nr:hypothetical protein [Bacteroidales bacterium]
MKRIVLTLSFVFITLGGLYSQSYNTYPELNKFKNWGLFGEVTFWKKTELTTAYGPLSFETYPQTAYSFGFEYDFSPANKWSFISGFMLQWYPFAHYIFTDTEHPSMTYGTGNELSDFGITIPIVFTFKQKLTNRVFLESRIGFKLSFEDPTIDNVGGIASNTIVDSLGQVVSSKEYFALVTSRTQSEGHATMLLGIGAIFDLDYALIKANISYNGWFNEPLVYGQWQFSNLDNPANNTRGYYKQPSNYWSFSLVFHLKKFKHKFELKL